MCFCTLFQPRRRLELLARQEMCFFCYALYRLMHSATSMAAELEQELLLGHESESELLSHSLD